ncbi:DUF3306 domain-containing protein [Phaeobacter sp. C3_T13_0]|uniref:DUF3306 domain-containing protein n=1 Tax=Phaeobacter cretensis TaxID=3342641 RepID=UPI0039BC8A96
MSGDDFWSRRRARVAEEMKANEAELRTAELAKAEGQLADKSDAEILEEMELPDPDTLGKGDDFSVFLRETVPARIRTRALRKLWRTNPVLANVDGLLDYGEDFTDSSMVVENLQTAYQVGKGMTAHVEELARQVEEAAALEGDDSDSTLAELELPEVAEVHLASPDTATGVTTTRLPTTPLRSAETLLGVDRDELEPDASTQPVEGFDTSEHAALPPRRMRFTFATDASVEGTAT